MAMIDYGTMVKVNGKIVNNGIGFMCKTDTGYVPCADIVENYFASVGDKNLIISFYKMSIAFFRNEQEIGRIHCEEPYESGKVRKHNYMYSLPHEKFINPFDCGIDVRVDALEDIFRTENTEDFDNDEFFGHGTSYWRLTKDAYGITDNYSCDSKKYYTKMKKNIRRVKQLEKLDKRASWKHYDGVSYPGRYYITFEYNGNKYEIVTGYGVDSSKSFYTDNNMDRFGYTAKEKEFMRRYMEGAYCDAVIY